MNRILLATVAVLATTVAQAETIYVAPGSAVHFSTKKPFKTAISGDEELLVLKPGATNQDLLIVANQPDNALTGSANVLLIDDQGKLVEDIRVNVTPFGEDLRDCDDPWVVWQNHNLLWVRHLLLRGRPPKPRNKGMGDADSMTVTTNRDGSTITTKAWSTPPTPPK